jgi:hypothetical protein
MRCPKCAKPNVHRSRPRTSWEEFVTSTLPYRYYRCHSCDWRELRKKQGPPSKPRRMRGLFFYVKVLLAILAIAVAGYMVIAPYTNLAKPVSSHHK